MATTEVTQLQYYKVMGNNPSGFRKKELGYDSRNNPVEKVSWYNAKEFVKKLNELEHTDKYRLPTEEEWEYAARAGSNTKWCFGDNVQKLKNYANIEQSTLPVASKKPNKWGLYDMHGNVWEWTSSCYTETYNNGCYKNYKAVRGGGIFSFTPDTRSASRQASNPEERKCYVGFRICKTK